MPALTPLGFADIVYLVLESETAAIVTQLIDESFD